MHVFVWECAHIEVYILYAKLSYFVLLVPVVHMFLKIALLFNLI